MSGAPELYVLGNASIDVTLNVPRLPRPGETLMAHNLFRAPGGKGLNQAVVAARAGARVRFCAPIGAEPETALIREALAREPFIDLRLIEANQPTDLSTLIVAHGGDNVIISTGDCADALTPYIAGVFIRPIRPTDWLLVQGNLSEPATWAAVSRATNVVFNTAPIRWHSPRILAAATVVIANETEAHELTGLPDPEAAAAVIGGKAGIVTLGAAGCILAQDGRITRFAAVEVAAVDTSGAGDTFCGVLAAGLAASGDFAAAIAHAQRAAALAVSRPGCFGALPSATELRP